MARNIEGDPNDFTVTDGSNNAQYKDKQHDGSDFVLPYGDHENDGIVQVSFTLPVEKGADKMIKERLGRPLIVVGAATGNDAHTVGLDAILNYKGFAGDHGLEAYSSFRVINMGSQVPNEVLVAKAREVRADAILVSQVVTQRNVHISNLTNLVELLEAEGLRDKVILIAGGPRITHALALELGYDAGFGAGTKPQDVASYLAQEVLKRKSLY